MKGLRLAIAQPYLFPYLGYFQLMRAVDRWVVYDDVQYIKSGWINRNQIRTSAGATMFTVPLAGASSSKRICDVEIEARSLLAWRDKFYKTLAQAYRLAPCYREVLAGLESLFETAPPTIAALDLAALRWVRDQLGLSTEIVPTSAAYGNAELRSQERVLDICRREGAQTYVNAMGGAALYDTATFAEHGITLRFHRMQVVPYPQQYAPFVSHLSVLDVLMNLGPEERTRVLAAYELVGSDAITDGAHPSLDGE